MHRRVMALAACLGLIAGCGNERTDLLAPDLSDVDVGPEMVASATEIGWLAEVAGDPYLEQLFASLPGDRSTLVLGAVAEFEAGLLAVPARSYWTFEGTLAGLDGAPSTGPNGPDDDLTQGVLGLYLDWSHTTLFEAERQPLGSVSDPGEH